MKKYILAIDQGTTSTRAILINKKGEAVFKAQRAIDCIYPKPGWVEENPDKIWISVIDVINELLVVASSSMDEVDSIGITNQRETTVVFEKETGKAVFNAIVWQSKQTQPLCEERNDKFDFIQQRTGLRMNPYFSASKIRYILDHIPNGQERAEKGELLFGTIDTWLMYKMSNGKIFATDPTNASRTMLYDIFTNSFSKELCDIWNIPMCMLPIVKDNNADFGEASFFSGNVHIHGVCGDQQSALFGQCCFHKGDSKNTYGTGCFMLMNIGDKPIISKQGLLTTVAWSLDSKVTYALEGSVFIGGAVIKWLRDELELISSAPEIDRLAESVPDSNGAYLVPAFVGLGTPYWDMYARGTIVGLTRGVKKAHICRAALEGIAYEVRDVLDTMVADSGTPINTLNVDGGACVSNVMMQFQADILNTKVCRPKNVETTALGAAYLAGLAVGFWKSKDDILCRRETEHMFEPSMSDEKRDNLYAGWKKAVERAKAWAE